MGALGFILADDPKKDKPFEVTFNVLGVRLDLGAAESGLIGVSHTDGRVEQVLEIVEGAITSDSLSRAEAACLAGRVRFLRAVRGRRASRDPQACQR